MPLKNFISVVYDLDKPEEIEKLRNMFTDGVYLIKSSKIKDYPRVSSILEPLVSLIPQVEKIKKLEDSVDMFRKYLDDYKWKYFNIVTEKYIKEKAEESGTLTIRQYPNHSSFDIFQSEYDQKRYFLKLDSFYDKKIIEYYNELRDSLDKDLDCPIVIYDLAYEFAELVFLTTSEEESRDPVRRAACEFVDKYKRCVRICR